MSAYMDEAIAEAREGIHSSHGGPFGCVIVKGGKIVGRGHNRVLIDHDPSSHGEIVAMRDAGKNLNTHDLSGCELYTTGEPCPMCLAACIWANIDKIYYGCTIADNADIGFRDEKMDKDYGGREAFAGLLEEADREACLELFDEYKTLDAQRY